MKSAGKEFLVGCMVLFALVVVGIFGYWMRVIGPFQSEVKFFVEYAFAGGIEIGSPVRVSGIKVGKVENIDFLSVLPDTENHPTLRVTISVNKRSAALIRQDSKFYVNMAGIIGERYLEISPGGAKSAALPPASTVRGVDPPRIDQLLSQGYGVFGRVQEFLEDNEEAVTHFIKEVNQLLSDMNRLLKGDDRRKIIALIDNLSDLTLDLKTMTQKLQTSESKEMFTHLRELINRAHDVDGPLLKKFFQEEGIRAKIF